MFRYRNQLIIATLGAFLLGCGLRQTSGNLRQQLFGETPIGSSMRDVARNNAERRRPVRMAGTVAPDSDATIRRAGAVSYMKVYLGHYRNPMHVDVAAYYLFDRTGRLSDIVVIKETDSL